MIHDYMRQSRIGRSGFPKLKGHLRIELKDSRGRAVKTIEGDNMITDALKDIFAANYCGAMDYRKLLPLYSKMLGGILCFGSNTLDVTSEGAAKDYFIPDNSTHPVIAHAGQTETSYGQADDITRGRPLDTSMIVQDGAVTLAWEWGSAAGNGTIYSLGLTHADVGDAGTGSNSQAFANMKPCINSSGYSFNLNDLVNFIGKDGYGYYIGIPSGTKITIYKRPFAYKQTGLVANEPYTANSLTTSHEVTTGTTYANNTRPFFCYDWDSNVLYLLYLNGTSSSSNKVKIDAINLSDFTNTHTEFEPDETINNLFTSIEANGQSNALPFYNGYVYLRTLSANVNPQGTTIGLLKVKLSNLADQTYMSRQVIPYGGGFIPTSSGKVFACKRMVINNGVVYPTSYESPDDHAAYDWNRIYNVPLQNYEKGLAGICARPSTNLAISLYYVSISKFYLASKYNLPTPITKQNSQSMVITYTLTEVS